MRRLLSLVVILVMASMAAVARDSRTYGSRNVARSKGSVSRSRSVGGHITYGRMVLKPIF